MLRSWPRSDPPAGPTTSTSRRHLAAFVIQTYSEAGDRVLDPFAGSGTTLAVASVWAGRRSVWNCSPIAWRQRGHEWLIRRGSSTAVHCIWTSWRWAPSSCA
ncbi:DNA methyltransferase [Nakamurella panacisegetis]|uniref:DNA methyltransferase n=1 Tax=Nakamurella panacisegetis TaxID=1090615 RepID=UPI000B881A80